MTAAAAMPLVAALPQPAAARGPRYRKRRRTASAAPESALFAGTAPTVGQVQAFIDRLWADLARGLQRTGRRPPYRQGDLLAGLALRYGRPEMLAALVAAVALEPAWAARRAKWLAEDGAWRRRWTTADSLAWSWHQRGVLTRSLLPLKLPA